jgi:hypothetical protein
MAGYRRQRTVFNLTFPDFDGLVVSIRGQNTGETLSLFENRAKSDVEATKYMIITFANSLIEWNLEDEDGVKVPTTVEGIESLDLPFVQELIDAWVTAVTGVDKELGKDSPSGGPSQEVSIPMEVL